MVDKKTFNLIQNGKFKTTEKEDLFISRLYSIRLLLKIDLDSEQCSVIISLGVAS